MLKARILALVCSFFGGETHGSLHWSAVPWTELRGPKETGQAFEQKETLVCFLSVCPYSPYGSLYVSGRFLCLVLARDCVGA